MSGMCGASGPSSRASRPMDRSRRRGVVLAAVASFGGVASLATVASLGAVASFGVATSLGAVTSLGASLLTAAPVAAQGRTHAVIVSGLGGAAEYGEAFHAEASQIHDALIERHGIPAENVTYLAEKVEIDPARIAMRSTRANVLKLLGEIARAAEPMDRLLVILIGHGTTGREEAQLNLPGPDLGPSDLGAGLASFPTQTLALVHTGTASGGFIEPLAGPNRILVAATSTARQLNATEFGRFFAEAIAGAGADLDKDDRVSLLEAFLFARQETARFYEDENEILTETAVLDDNGDGKASEEPGQAGPDGPLAATFQLGGISGTAAQTPDDPELARLYEERAAIQVRVDALRAGRGDMTDEEYLGALEPLLVELALKNREIRAREGGAS